MHVPEFIEELEKNVDPKFVKELGKPYNILEYTRLIGEKSFEMQGETSQPGEFRDKVMFAAARDAQLRQFITQRRLKSAEDAYNDLLRDENCKEVLLVLWQSGAVAINELEIRSKITERNNIQPLSSSQCSTILRRISTYEGLIDVRDDAGESQSGAAYILTDTVWNYCS